MKRSIKKGLGFGLASGVITTLGMMVGLNASTGSKLAIIGGIITAFAVYVLAWNKGVQGFRLIIVGISISAMLNSFNAYLITRANVEDALVVGFWGAGSIHRVSWASLIPSMIIAAVIVVCAMLLSRSLQFMR